MSTDVIRSVYHVGPRQVEVRTFEKVKPPPDAILAKIEMCGICGTDIHIWKNAPRAPGPIGHEPLYVIEEFGDQAVRDDLWGQPLNEGDRIVALSPWWCGECMYCRFFHQEWMCSWKRPTRGASRETPKRAPWNVPRVGGYSTHNYIPSNAWIFKVPDSLPSKIAVLTDPLGTSQFARSLADRAGLTMVIQGSGAIGLLALFSAKLAGVWKAIVVGGPKNRLEICEEFGADHTINVFEVTDPEERIRQVKELTPGGFGADIVYEGAGVPSAFYEGIEMLRRGGTFIEVGFFTDRGSIMINPYKICAKNLKLYSFHAYDGEQFGYGIRMLDRYQDKYPLYKVVTHEFKLEEAQKGLEASEQGIAMKAIVVP